ncbi:MAG: MscL family protein [bacterium]|nr:MscL family protein [bacterium]
MKKHARGFMEFIREQGVVGLAIGFILGTAVSKLVASLVADIINPILSIFLGATGELKQRFLQIGQVKILWGDFIAAMIDFLVIALVVYIGFKMLRLDRLDKKSHKK